MKTVLWILSALSLYVLCTWVVPVSHEQVSPRVSSASPVAAHNRVSPANFDAVSLGMTLGEVTSILGQPTRTIYENVGGFLPSSAYAWDGWGLRLTPNITVIFEYGKVTQKRQAFLR